MAESISATEARIHLGEVMERVNRNHEILVVERHGKPQAAIIPADAVATLEKAMAADRQQTVMERIAARGREVQERLDREGLTMEPAWQVIQEMREERSEHLYRCLVGDTDDRGPAGDG